MPESYQVMTANLKRTIPPKPDNKGGQWPEKHVYALQLDPLNGGQPIEAEELRFHKAPSPKEGEHVEGTVKPGNFGLTFVRAKAEAPRPGPTTLNANPTTNAGTYRPMDPQREAVITRMHSEHMALEDAKVRAMLDKEGFKKVFSCVWVKKVTDWYVAEAKGENPEAHYFDFDRVGEGQ